MATKRQRVCDDSFAIATVFPGDVFVSDRDKTGCLDSSPLQVDLLLPEGFKAFAVKTGAKLSEHVFVELLYSDLTLPMVYSADTGKMETLRALHCRDMRLHYDSRVLSCFIERQGFPLSSTHALRPFVLLFSLAVTPAVSHVVKSTSFFVQSRMRATGRHSRGRKSSVPISAVSAERQRRLHAALHMLTGVGADVPSVGVKVRRPAVPAVASKAKGSRRCVKRIDTPDTSEGSSAPIQDNRVTVAPAVGFSPFHCASIVIPSSRECSRCTSYYPLSFDWNDVKDDVPKEEEDFALLGSEVGHGSLRSLWPLYDFESDN